MNKTRNEEMVGKVLQACRMLAGAEEAPSLEELAHAAAMGKFHFHRTFLKYTGMTPKAYAKGCRAEKVREHLVKGSSVTDAIYAAGYASSSRFYEEAAAVLGMKPSQYRKGAKGEIINFTVIQSSLGYVLVACTEMGVCAVSLGDEPMELVRELQRSFCAADLVGDDEKNADLVSRVILLLENAEVAEMLPLDVRGTAFQMRVWQALQKIPSGETRSYSELAKSIGSPKSVRAVSGACAANKIAVVIPCHRVVRSDGSLSGYRWGVARKRMLLDQERKLF